MRDGLPLVEVRCRTARGHRASPAGLGGRRHHERADTAHLRQPGQHRPGHYISPDPTTGLIPRNLSEIDAFLVAGPRQARIHPSDQEVSR